MFVSSMLSVAQRLVSDIQAMTTGGMPSWRVHRRRCWRHLAARHVHAGSLGLYLAAGHLAVSYEGSGVAALCRHNGHF
ncbi:MAG: hypothetical protein JWO26_3372 [Rhodospirillales bacterium]|jgi:hypothetical protein|nr:hypothetical protein [Rhodospirillales bacterium]